MTKKILALKYRPQEFKDLIGQEVMSETITNAIKLGKTPNAYLLTGIRGVGKTTTARLIAKALNCTKNFSEGEKCKSDENCHCKEIVNSNHMDVLEMDAASKTGVDDVRDLIEFSRYGPTSSKYKIFIIDEVHMLSQAAFNALLKTLEEPPPHVKFVFATTESHKFLPTIVSRCQRFEFRSIPVDLISLKLKEISYIHAEAYPAGELKHGPLALIDENMPVIALAPESEIAEKLVSNLEEVKARGGTLYVFSDPSISMDLKSGRLINMPKCDFLLTPIIYTIPLQILSYEVALLRGTDIDQPRNLAKSVTVE